MRFLICVRTATSTVSIPCIYSNDPSDLPTLLLQHWTALILVLLSKRWGNDDGARMSKRLSWISPLTSTGSLRDYGSRHTPTPDEIGRSMGKITKLRTKPACGSKVSAVRTMSIFTLWCLCEKILVRRHDPAIRCRYTNE